MNTLQGAVNSGIGSVAVFYAQEAVLAVEGVFFAVDGEGGCIAFDAEVDARLAVDVQ